MITASNLKLWPRLARLRSCAACQVPSCSIALLHFSPGRLVSMEVAMGWVARLPRSVWLMDAPGRERQMALIYLQATTSLVGSMARQ
ncbi:hypothetical protein LZ32DRAFT_103050 [Colletotrichum eremochloae]|nr:hypothetical protein LZ32DRAFT_103050 [Colletotrichum eremochloae]